MHRQVIAGTDRRPKSLRGLPDDTDINRLYDVPGAALRMSSTPRFIRAEIAARRLPYIQPGGRRHKLRIAECDIRAYLKRWRVAARGEERWSP